MGCFAVIDTETNWENKVMSIGTVVADGDSFRPLSAMYHVITPEYMIGGMFSAELFPDRGTSPVLCTREEAISQMRQCFGEHGVKCLYAYNASFDRSHLPELGKYKWFDIMRIAAYRQHNPMIPVYADCCSTGRLKRGFGVEAMLRLLARDRDYRESHNALFDAMDELEIMRLLNRAPGDYIEL